jgi:hypothetical protein
MECSINILASNLLYYAVETIASIMPRYNPLLFFLVRDEEGVFLQAVPSECARQSAIVACNGRDSHSPIVGPLGLEGERIPG